MGQRELSCLINQQLGVHFFDFVNRYRVEKAAAVLIDPAKHEMSVLEIASETGFNTKSSFNAAFSKHLGSTPTEYRQRHFPRVPARKAAAATSHRPPTSRIRSQTYGRG